MNETGFNQTELNQVFSLFPVLTSPNDKHKYAVALLFLGP